MNATGLGMLVGAAYLGGSLPTGVWFARWAGVDVRSVGSGNVGATNVARTAGLLPGLLTLISDVAKGIIPVLLARALDPVPLPAAAAGLAAIFGHVYSLFLGGSGGKGVATGFGVFLGLAPAAAAGTAAVFAAVAVATRYVSVASLTAATVLPLLSFVLGYSWPVCGAALITDLIIVVRHRQNLLRLVHGLEPRFQLKR